MKKILLIEDDNLFIKILHDALGDKEFSIFEAKSGEEGLKIATEEHPNLIILDVMLPEMDGLAVLKKIREDEWGKEVKVLLLTNSSDKEKISESLKLEADGYLFKPDWKIKNLVDKIHEQLGENS